MNESFAATALYRDKNNHRRDYKGTRSQVINNFIEEMKRRGVIWGRLFNQNNGELVHTYNSTASINQTHYFITNDNIIHGVFPDGTSSMKSEFRVAGNTVTVMEGVGEETYTLHQSLTSLALTIEGNQ